MTRKQNDICGGENGANKKAKLLNEAAKIIRVFTTAPVVSFVLFTVLYFAIPELATHTEYFVTVLLYTVLPLCAYPIHLIVPRLRKKGRHGQRTLAMVMACAGYLLSLLYGVLAGVNRMLLVLYLAYALSCSILLIIDKLLNFHASGHACGLCGPVAVLMYFTGWYSLIWGAALFALVLWSSLRMKRHTVPQFIVGGAVSVAVFLLLAVFVI